MTDYKLVPVEPTADIADLIKRLRIKAGVIELGELIAWGSDSALMREAADVLERERKRRFDGNEQASREYREDMKSLLEALEAIERMDFDDHSLTNAVGVARNALAAHRKEEV